MKNIVIILLVIFSLTLLFSGTIDEAKKLYETEQYQEAAEMLEDMVKQDSENLSVNRLAGLTYFKLTQNPDAGTFKIMGYFKKYKNYLDKVIEAEPKDLECLEIMANSYFYPPKIAGGNKKKALHYLEMIKKISPQKGMNLEMEFCINDKEYEKAENIGQQLINEYPEDTGVYYSLGMLYQDQKNYNQAFKAFETNIEKDNQAWNAMYQIGRTAVFSETNLERGIECLINFTKHEPGKDEPGLDSAFWRLGMLYELQGKPELAILAYESGLKINPDNSECKKSLKKLK